MGAEDTKNDPPIEDGANDNDETQDETEEGDDGDVKSKKRKERLEQNRISARESRKRKKTMIEELQRTVITLSRENKELNERNESLRRQLMDIGTKHPNAVPIHAIMGGPPPTNVDPQGAAAPTSTAGGVAPGAANPQPMAMFPAMYNPAAMQPGAATLPPWGQAQRVAPPQQAPAPNTAAGQPAPAPPANWQAPQAAPPAEQPASK